MCGHSSCLYRSLCVPSQILFAAGTPVLMSKAFNPVKRGPRKGEKLSLSKIDWSDIQKSKRNW